MATIREWGDWLFLDAQRLAATNAILGVVAMYFCWRDKRK